MDSFFGIGLFELVLIAVIALVVLGPERLPGAMREVAKWIRQLRSLSSDFQSQFSEEFKMLDEINPRRIINDALDPNAQSKPAPGQAAKPSAGQSTNQATASPLAAKPVTPPAPKPAAPAAAKPVNAAFPTGPTVAAATAAAQAGANAAPGSETENTILPPAQSAVEPEPPAASADTGSQAPAASPAASPVASPAASPAEGQEPEASQ